MPRLDIYHNFKLLLQVQLREDSLWIGRGGNCQIALNDPEISRRHAHIVKHNDVWEIQNHGRNGSLLNDSLLVASTALNYGDRIYIGSHTLVFQPEDAPVLRWEVIQSVATEMNLRWKPPS